MKIAFYTLGCKVNTYETESIWEIFKSHGYNRVKSDEYADVYIVNTCTVTNSGDSKSRKAIRKLIKNNPESVIAVMGCYSQMDPEKVYEIDGVDIVIGTKHREQIYPLVEKVLRERTRIKNVTDVSKYRVFDETHVTNFTENTRAFLKIQDGCNNFCSYCIIPFARGPVRSRDKDSILEEARDLVKNKYHEIVLTGIHTGGYGTDLEGYSFYDLLEDLSSIDNLDRIRLSSIEINELTEDILNLIASNKKFAKHLHIPLQSGSERVLSEMRRKYTKDEFRNMIVNIRNIIPNIAITTDVIVGYPSETDEEYLEMFDFIKEMKFSELHVFPYSRRSGTIAAKMKDQINGIIKSYRVNQLLVLSEELANNYIDAQNTLSVIFETSDSEFTYGHSDNYLYVKTDKDLTLHNKLIDTKIIKGTHRNLYVKKIG
ncbi:Threonylcarbamoyladenosine tRNA methylthiotransferase MtaB [Candidatus Izimaplasma bacterium HR1]|jgi:threonylcarbamoyladenosine tRNA methylthiotransferase MtaB|uniref:tRNA (N(6)-L-threonylcarbamoyladenosine(37)-C(2))- methylthiotransferase MtaB n=1 Tax=Candidatus Izimoplasma sp. HR1 TaxID=1541959 RepID=UPI0004F5FEBD|nr:Threonylcarbamoyladenosine tRNA methylthiotransferase MtaB [Candidatus Izimaplasma bacterium HR1]